MSARKNNSSSSKAPKLNQVDTDKRPDIHPSGLYDLQQIKRFLDDELISFMEKQGYTESTTVSNIKLLFGTIAVVASLYSHLGVGEFPASWWKVFACVVIYFVCSFLITISTIFLDASATFAGKLSLEASLISKDLPPRVFVHTTLGARGTSEFQVQIRKTVRGKKEAIEDTRNYEIYFSKDGYFLRNLFTENMKATLARAIKSNSRKKQ